MLTIQTRMHPGMPGESRSVLSMPKSPHLRQGSVGDSSAIYSVASALVVLGVMSRARVRASRFVLADDPLRKFWDKAQESYFGGCSVGQAIALLETLDTHLRWQVVTGATSDVVAYVEDRLSKNDTVLLHLTEGRTRQGPWVLAVGAEFHVVGAQRTPSALLCLDSTRPAPPVGQGNTRLELPAAAARTRRLRYRTPDGNAGDWTCKTAIALSLRQVKARTSRSAKSGG